MKKNLKGVLFGFTSGSIMIILMLSLFFPEILEEYGLHPEYKNWASAEAGITSKLENIDATQHRYNMKSTQSIDGNLQTQRYDSIGRIYDTQRDILMSREIKRCYSLTRVSSAEELNKIRHLFMGYSHLPEYRYLVRIMADKINFKNPDYSGVDLALSIMLDSTYKILPVDTVTKYQNFVDNIPVDIRNAKTFSQKENVIKKYLSQHRRILFFYWFRHFKNFKENYNNIYDLKDRMDHEILLNYLKKIKSFNDLYNNTIPTFCLDDYEMLEKIVRKLIRQKLSLNKGIAPGSLELTFFDDPYVFHADAIGGIQMAITEEALKKYNSNHNL